MTTAKVIGTAWRMAQNDAERYVKGGKAERRTIRSRIVKAHAKSTEIRDAYLRQLTTELEGYAEEIKAGLRPRTIRPSKLYYLVDGYLAAHVG